MTEALKPQDVPELRCASFMLGSPLVLNGGYMA